MSVMPVRTDPGLHYSQEVYMMETMQHNVGHKQTRIQHNSTFFTLKQKAIGCAFCASSILCIKLQTALHSFVFISTCEFNL